MSAPTRAQVERAVAVEVAASPGTLIPVGLGLSGFMIFGLTGLGAFASLVVLLGGAAGCVVRLLRGGGRARGRALRKLAARLRQARNDELKELEWTLRGDGDPRTQRLLAGMRGLVTDLESPDLWKGVDDDTAASMQQNVDRLFSAGVENLRASVELVERAQALSSKPARRALEQRRRELIVEVEQSIDHLAQLVAEVSKLGELGSPTTARALRDRLNSELEIAKRVNAAMHDAVAMPAKLPEIAELDLDRVPE